MYLICSGTKNVKPKLTGINSRVCSIPYIKNTLYILGFLSNLLGTYFTFFWNVKLCAICGNWNWIWILFVQCILNSILNSIFTKYYAHYFITVFYMKINFSYFILAWCIYSIHIHRYVHRRSSSQWHQCHGTGCFSALKIPPIPSVS